MRPIRHAGLRVHDLPTRELLRIPPPSAPRSTSGTQQDAIGATIRRHRLPRVAEGCNTGLSKPISLLAVAHRCCVLRSGWCQ